MMTAIFGIFLIGAIIVALSCAGITRMIGDNFVGLNWLRIIRVVLGIIVGLAICYFLCFFGVVAGIIGLVGGFILGLFLPTIMSLAWGIFKWWMKLLVVVLVIAAFIAVVF